MSDTYPAYAEQWADPGEVTERGTDPRWLYVGIWVSVLTLLGVAFSMQTALTLFTYTFSFKASLVYVPLATLAILFLGYARYPMAAAIFYGYLGLGQAAHAEEYLLGDVNGGLTFEMVLAIPLILVGMMGPSGAEPERDRPMPSVMKMSFAGLLISALISTVLARSPYIASWTYLGRFMLPVAVTLVTYRRIRNIRDYEVIWFGFLVGMMSITAFNFARAVLGFSTAVWQIRTINQRYIGASGSYGLPMLYLTGTALWLGASRAQAGKILRGVLWISLVGVVGLLFWLAACRGPTIGLGLLVIWWMPKHFLARLYRPSMLLLAVLGGGALIYVLRYSLGKTTLDQGMITERISELFTRGLTQESRWAIWMSAVGHWQDSPIWGVGLNNWVVVDRIFQNVHGAAAGILFDMGLLGVAVYTLLFGATLVLSGRSVTANLPWQDRMFFNGCRAGWVVMMLIMAVELPLTSGQPFNNIFTYAAYFYPLLVMTVYSRHSAPEYEYETPPEAPGYPVPWTYDAGYGPAAAPAQP